MRIYFAPMQGVTGWPFRMTHLKHYGGVDRYYMPFISVHQTRAMKGGEKRDMDPSHNEMDRMVPQLLPAGAEDTLFYMDMIRAAGYDEVSLNLGCPARTVVTKGKGSGMLADTGKLDGFLEHLFTGMTSAGNREIRPGESAASGLRVTVKTRIGMNDTDQISELIRIYNRYPIAEVQVHARLGKDAYNGTPDREAFRRFYEEIRHPVCYNGDIRSMEDFRKLHEDFPDLSAVMIGRGLVADPMLAEKIQAELQPDHKQPDQEQPDHEQPDHNQPDHEQPGNLQPGLHQGQTQPKTSEHSRLIRFHDDLCNAWYECYGQEHPAICRMLEIWDYLGASFPGNERMVRKIRKARDLRTYRQLAAEVLARDYHPGVKTGAFPVGH
ncbi:MAG: tRNA-dihydrouridine synthase family protein [Lachnospiraceae bacterium]|nr:tRNA-dihydrouridine synthase family protein [Lachnospiraceae bacterium]